jgi:hypothetical protein
MCRQAHADLLRRAGFRAEHCPDSPRVSARLEGSPGRDIREAFGTVTTWDAFAAESFGSPVPPDFNNSFSGPSARLRLLVKGTQTMVAIRLRLKALRWTTSAGRRNRRSKPTGSPKSAHQI